MRRLGYPAKVLERLLVPSVDSFLLFLCVEARVWFCRMRCVPIMQKPFIISGCIFAAAAVLLGAFGAHALKERLDPNALQVFETGVRYQMYHALALLLLGALVPHLHFGWAAWAGRFFAAGIVLFSGSLYLLSCRSLLGLEQWTFLGPLTPAGGLSFVAGWMFLLFSYLKSPNV
jgi:uncharacterized membrane protein YgdD (TMEM256/DUF423 family)